MTITRESWDSRLLKWSGLAVGLFIVAAFASQAHVAKAASDDAAIADTSAWLVAPVPVHAFPHHHHHHRGG